MKCWVSKKGKKGAWGSILRDLFLIFKNEDFGFDIFKKI